MMTVITEVSVQAGQEPRWDQAFAQRVRDARQQPGWVSRQVLIPLDAPNKRTIVGTWQTRADWEAWHGTEVFRSTRQELNEIEQSGGEEKWYEVMTMQGSEA